jgi:hypothetical protein
MLAYLDPLSDSCYAYIRGNLNNETRQARIRLRIGDGDGVFSTLGRGGLGGFIGGSQRSNKVQHNTMRHNQEGSRGNLGRRKQWSNALGNAPNGCQVICVDRFKCLMFVALSKHLKRSP